MSDEIYLDENNKASFAFLGPRAAIWHRLGQNLHPDASIEEWIEGSGMGFRILESPTTYNTISREGIPAVRTFENKRTLYRDDTGAPLSIVGKDFKLEGHQPRQIIEFFRDLVDIHGMRLNTAGVLFGGKRFWALAETGREGEVVKGDVIKAFLLLTSSVDYSSATIGKYVSTRVVCNNTMNIALRESGNVIKTTHKRELDARQVKIDLGLLEESWETFMDNLKKLSERKMSDEEVTSFLKKSFYDPKKEEKDQTWGVLKTVNQCNLIYHNGQGSEFSYGTAYGVWNSVTDTFTNVVNKNDSKAFVRGLETSEGIKMKIFEDLLQIA